MGYQPVPMGYATPPKSKVTAALLAFFLGGFGIHNFYLGYTAKGVIQLVLTLTFYGILISGIWAFVEFIMILTGLMPRAGRCKANWPG